MKNSEIKEIFTSWAYWKPIVLVISGITGVILFFIFATPMLLGIVAAMAVIGFFLFLLHMIGYSCYSSYMANLKRNYEKLTGKKWDDD